jgi:hypothetical protein
LQPLAANFAQAKAICPSVLDANACGLWFKPTHLFSLIVGPCMERLRAVLEFVSMNGSRLTIYRFVPSDHSVGQSDRLQLGAEQPKHRVRREVRQPYPGKAGAHAL